MFFPALDSIVKEKAFGDAKEKLGGKQLDIFVVNSYSSGFQVRLSSVPACSCTASMGKTDARAAQFMCAWVLCGQKEVEWFQQEPSSIGSFKHPEP